MNAFIPPSLVFDICGAYYLNRTLLPMIRGIKDMIEGCTEQASRRSKAGSALRFIAAGIAREIQRRRAGRQSVRREVERHIEPLLASGAARIDRVASGMGCSRQTLYRRLKAEGLTFEQILDALRHRHALKLMRHRELSVKEAAYQLGFSDPAAFSRAFKRWTGQSPAGFRTTGHQNGAR
ncbi:helix-turn-helix transcriptional regulator [Sphingomonas koreensis]